jgi:membrane protease YdiL (CAAX protease family)
MSDPEAISEPVVPAPERQREPFWGWTDVVLFAVGAPVFIAGVAIALHTLLLTLHQRPDTALALLGMQGLLYLAAYGLLWLILMVRHSESAWDALRWPVSTATGLKLFAAGFVLAFAAAVLGVAMNTPQIENPVVKFMTDPASIVVVIVFASTLGPAAEEAVFRGFLQPVATRTLGMAGGIAGTSLLFAALHGFEYQWRWQYLLLVFAASLAFGWTRVRWNSTGASTLLHAGYNLMFFIGYLFQGRTSLTHG